MKTELTSNERDVLACSFPLHERKLGDPMIREHSRSFSPSVSVQGCEYLVDFGLGNSRRFHRVGKDKTCSCGNPVCPAIEAVRSYLQAGGVRAPDPEGMPACPICGSSTTRDRNWDGKYTHELGWRCEKGGILHFLQAKAERIKRNIAAHPWLIPPAPGYPGVRREDLRTWEQCEEINQRVFLETGYDPKQ